MWNLLTTLAEPVSSTGCKTPLRETWADKSVLDASLSISLFFLNIKIKLLDHQQRTALFFIRDYLEEPCIPEILANSFCDLTDKKLLREIAAPLEAFQTYSVSLYDQIDDNHLVRDGDPTVLGRYGIKKQPC